MDRQDYPMRDLYTQMASFQRNSGDSGLCSPGLAVPTYSQNKRGIIDKMMHSLGLNSRLNTTDQMGAEVLQNNKPCFNS